MIEPGEFLNEDGLPKLFLFSPTYNRAKDETGDDAGEREIIETIKSLWTGEEKFLLTRNPNGTPYKQQFADVRDIVQGLVLGIEKDEALGEEFTLGGAALFKWEDAVPYLSERYNLDYVDARALSSNYFELDLTKIKTLLGYRPEHDLESILDTAEAMRRGEDVGIVPTGVPWGKA